MIGRVRDGLVTLAALQALRTGFALLLLGPLYRELASAMERSTSHAVATAEDAALALEIVARAGPRMLSGALIALIAYALLGPWLQQVLLHSLAGATMRSAAALAGRRYLAALITRASAFSAFAVIAALSVLTLETALAALPAGVALEAVVRAAFVACVLAAALALASAHDLAAAALAHGARLRHALRIGVACCSRGAVGRHLLAVAAAAALIAAGELASRVPIALPYALGPGVLLAVQQALLFAALCARAAWLAHALARTEPSAEPG